MATNTNRKTKTAQPTGSIIDRRVPRPKCVEPGTWVIARGVGDEPFHTISHRVAAPGPIVPPAPSGFADERLRRHLIFLGRRYFAGALEAGVLPARPHRAGRVHQYCADQGHRELITELFSVDGFIGTLSFVPADQGR